MAYSTDCSGEWAGVKNTLNSTEPLAELKEGPMAEPTAPGRTAECARKAKFGEKNRPVCEIRKEQKQN